MRKGCRKCGATIPNKIKINGKEHNLSSRKFCLECSPFMKHNTSAVNPIERGRKAKYKDWTQEQKDNQVTCLYKRGLERKEKLLKIRGDKCSMCGYNKSTRVLSFHHRNPETKKFGLSLNNLWGKPMDILIEEAEKCDVLCMNCHAELHDTNRSNIVLKVNKKYGTNF